MYQHMLSISFASNGYVTGYHAVALCHRESHAGVSIVGARTLAVAPPRPIGIGMGIGGQPSRQAVQGPQAAAAAGRERADASEARAEQVRRGAGELERSVAAWMLRAARAEVHHISGEGKQHAHAAGLAYTANG